MKFLKMLGIRKSTKSVITSADDNKIVSGKPPSSGEVKPNPEDCYCAFLAIFKYYRKIDEDEWIASWSETLGKPYKEVIGDFIDQNLLKKAGIKDKLGTKLSVQELKQSLKEHELLVSGKKDELLDRYLEAMPREAEEKVAMIGDLYICTPKGLQKIEQYRRRMDDFQQSIDLELRRLLIKGSIDQAIEIVRQFKQRSPGSHPVYMPNEDDVKIVMGIKSVPGLTEAEAVEGRINVASRLLWEGRINGIDPVAKHAYFLLVRKGSIEQLKHYAKQEFVTGIEIFCLDDSCLICQAAARRKYPLNRAPLIPIDGCTHTNGCRCSYTPVVD